MLLSPQCLHRQSIPLAALIMLAITLPAAANGPTSAVWSQNTRSPAYPDIDFAKSTAYPVVRVVDPHRIVVLIQGQEATVRMIGVDSPRSVKPAQNDQTHRQAATRFTANLLRGESVYLEYDPTQPMQDHDGQTMAYVFRAPDGLFVDAEIVRQGFGRSRDGRRFADLLRYCEKKARDSRKGRWSAATKLGSSEPTKTKQHPRQAAPKQLMVYVMPAGLEYHNRSCPLLDTSPIAMPLYKALSGYVPCATCKPPR